MSGAYLDASALVKLFKPEVESPVLAAALRDHEVWISSEIVAVEAACTARRAGDEGMVRLAEAVVASVTLVPFTAAISNRAARAYSRRLRALDAVHAATALAVADECEAIFAYDDDLSLALRAESAVVLSPGAPV